MNDELIAAISKDLGIEDLPEQERQQLIGQFGQVAMKAASIAVLEKMSPEKRDEFMTVAQTGNPDAIKALLDKEVPGHEELARAAVQKEVEAFRAAKTAA